MFASPSGNDDPILGHLAHTLEYMRDIFRKTQPLVDLGLNISFLFPSGSGDSWLSTIPLVGRHRCCYKLTMQTALTVGAAALYWASVNMQDFMMCYNILFEVLK